MRTDGCPVVRQGVEISWMGQTAPSSWAQDGVRNPMRCAPPVDARDWGAPYDRRESTPLKHATLRLQTTWR